MKGEEPRRTPSDAAMAVRLMAIKFGIFVVLPLVIAVVVAVVSVGKP